MQSHLNELNPDIFIWICTKLHPTHEYHWTTHSYFFCNQDPLITLWEIEESVEIDYIALFQAYQQLKALYSTNMAPPPMGPP